MITRAGVNWISVSGSARRVPAGQRADVVGGDVRAVLGAEQVLQQHLEAERQALARPRRPSSRKISYRSSPTSSVPRAPKLSLLVPVDGLTGHSLVSCGRSGPPPSAAILPQPLGTLGVAGPAPEHYLDIKILPVPGRAQPLEAAAARRAER